MAWYSHTLAFAILDDPANGRADPRSLLKGPGRESDPFVYAPSRNGCLTSQLGSICAHSANGDGLYLLKDASLLGRGAVLDALSQIDRLMNEITLKPALVVEATKEAHTPDVTLRAAGFEPRPAQRVYPRDAIISDGWVYNYTAGQVSLLLDQSCASQTPCPEDDPDGESLLYVFNFLRSHLSLLRTAAQSGRAVVYGETNP